MTHEFGIRLLHSVEEALQINKNSRTDFWWKTINKEIDGRPKEGHISDSYWQ